MAGIRGAVAVAGVGESEYYKHGRSPDREFVLTIKAILAACEDAGISPKSLDGFVSFADDRNSGIRVANALGVREMRWSTMQWGGGGAGGAGAVQQAAAAVAAGFAERVVVYRGLSQGEFGRFGAALPRRAQDSLRVAYGANTAGEWSAPRMMRYFHETGIDPTAQRAVSLASYHHAQQNPRAVMHGRPLTEEKYDESRWIVEPWRLYDFCQENDGAAALIVTSAEHARDLTDTPAYLLAAAQGSGPRGGAFIEGVYDSPVFATAEFRPVARRLFEMAGLAPADVDVAQSYENFSGAVVVSLIEHGFCTPEEAGEFFTVENLTAPHGRLPLNTSGGNLAEAYIHGLELCLEAVRQIRGDSPNPVPGAKVSFVSSGPMVVPASNALFGTEEALG
jgi:acetyl-CoA acetyltransferase